MFDKLLEESVAQGEVITAAVVHPAHETVQDPTVAEVLIAARRVFANPEHIQRLVIRMGTQDGDKSKAWW